MPDSASPDDTEGEGAGIHITSDPDRTEIEQPDPTGAPEASGLPFRILLVSDLVPGRTPEDWSAGDHVHRVDANRFVDFMAEMSPSLTLEMRNTLGTRRSRGTWSSRFRISMCFGRSSSLGRWNRRCSSWTFEIWLRKGGAIDIDTYRTQLDERSVDMDWAGTLSWTRAAGDELEARSASTSHEGKGSHPSHENREIACSQDVSQILCTDL